MNLLLHISSREHEVSLKSLHCLCFLSILFDSALMEGYPQMSGDFYLYNQIINEVFGAGVIAWW